VIRKFIEKENKFYECLFVSQDITHCSPFLKESCFMAGTWIETTIRDFPIGSQVKFDHLDYV
jgi:hypothetical protein